MQTKTKAVAHDLPARERFGEYVSRHIVCRAVYHVDGAASNYLSNKMESYVDVLCPGMVVVVRGEFECCLVVTEQHRLCLQLGKQLAC